MYRDSASVQLRALPVFVGDLRFSEQVGELSAEGGQVLIRGRKTKTAHRGNALRHFGELDRIVVDEDERLEAEVQAPRDLFNLHRLRTVAGPQRHEVVLGDARAPAPERSGRRFEIVSADGAQQHAVAFQFRELRLKDEVLEPGSLRPAMNAVDPVLGHHAAPENVVEIGDQDLA